MLKRKIVRSIESEHTSVAIVFKEYLETSSLSITSTCLLEGEQSPGIGYVGYNLSQCGMLDLAKYADQAIGLDVLAEVVSIVHEINGTTPVKATA